MSSTRQVSLYLFLVLFFSIFTSLSNGRVSNDFDWKVGTGAFEIYIYTKYIREGKTEWNSTITKDDGSIGNFTFRQSTVERVEITKIENDIVYGKKQFGYYPCETPCDRKLNYIITEEESIVTEVMKTYGNYWDWNHSWDKSVFGENDNYNLHDSPGSEGSIIYSDGNIIQKWYIWGGWLYYFYLKIGNTETEIQMLSWWKKKNEADSAPGFGITFFLAAFITLVIIRSVKRTNNNNKFT